MPLHDDGDPVEISPPPYWVLVNVNGGATGYHMVKTLNDMFSRFDTKHKCDRQTDECNQKNTSST